MYKLSGESGHDFKADEAARAARIIDVGRERRGIYINVLPGGCSSDPFVVE